MEKGLYWQCSEKVINFKCNKYKYKVMKKIDRYNLRKVILDEASQIMEGLKLAEGTKIPGKFKSITISGMGGSALPGNILRIFVNNTFSKGEKRLAIYQNRFYSLPPEAHEQCLNIVCSYSGNTEETVASLQECIKHKLPTVGISQGGKIQAMCKKNNIPHIELPNPYENFQPRMATGYFVFAIFQLLINCKLIKFDVSDLEKTAKRLEKRIQEYEKYGKRLAKKIKGKTPVIYSNTYFKSVANIWKIKINENAKTPAFWNYFPELNHNEMVGFTLPQTDFFFLMLEDDKDHPQNKKRFFAMKKMMKKQGMNSEIITIEGRDLFEKVFSSLALGDWTSYYLALEYGIDPTPVDMVEEFKEIIK